MQLFFGMKLKSYTYYISKCVVELIPIIRKVIYSLIFKLVTFFLLFSKIDLLIAKAEIDIETPSAILVESSTGQTILEKNAEEIRSPASLTKIMTLLLTFERLEKGIIHLEDPVITSEYAMSMGGSQVYLAEGEIQTLETMIKCIAMASGNDASVAVAEFIAGTEAEFVKLMNDKAKSLGMRNTHFVDCCGLSDSDEHYTCAKDVAIMSRELIEKYPAVLDYTKIWMEDMVHKTYRGESKFTLSSTNKLLKQYPWTTGLKTGSTDKAKYCLSATAEKDGVELIAVVMGAEDYKIRFRDAMKLLEFGFAVSNIYFDENDELIAPMKVVGGKKDCVNLYCEGPFSYLDTKGQDLHMITKFIALPEKVVAPIKANDVAGEIIYKLDDKKIGAVPIYFAEDLNKATYFDCYKKINYLYFSIF